MNRYIILLFLLFLFSFSCSVNETTKPTSSLESFPPPEQLSYNGPTPTPFPTRYTDGFDGTYNISEKENPDRQIINLFTYNNGNFSVINSEKGKLYLNSFNKYGIKQINDLLIFQSQEDYFNDKYYFYYEGYNDNILISTLNQTHTINFRLFDGYINKLTFEIPLGNINISDLSMSIDNEQNIVVTYTTNNEYKNSITVNKYNKNGILIFSDNIPLESTGKSYYKTIVKTDNNQNIIVIWNDLTNLSAKIYNSQGKTLAYKNNLVTNLEGAGGSSIGGLIYNMILDEEGNLIVVWNSYYTSNNAIYFSSYIQKFTQNFLAIKDKVKIFDFPDGISFLTFPYLSKDDIGNIFIYESRLNTGILLNKDLEKIPLSNNLLELIKDPSSINGKIIFLMPDGNFIMAYSTSQGNLYYKRLGKTGNYIINNYF